MFNLLISGVVGDWDTDSVMRMDSVRFKEHTHCAEAEAISLQNPESLRALEGIPSLLMYEASTGGPGAEVVRVGKLRDISLSGSRVSFYLEEEGTLKRSEVLDLARHLDLDVYEQNRTHWAIKEGHLPQRLLQKIAPGYDVVLSFAGENREYVDQVAAFLRANEVKVFYDRFEEADLWGKNLAVHFDLIYRTRARYCVLFISKHYAEKMWTKHERSSALARALQENTEYILPVRFDGTNLPGIPPTTGTQFAAERSPADICNLILQKLGLSPRT